MDTDLTSDILIYNILKDSRDKLIQACNIKFIDKSVPAEEDNTIYVANIDLESTRETFNSAEYKALVNIYVKTKNTDYIEGSRFLRTVIKHIKYVLREDIQCKQRHLVFRNTSYEYGGKYTLKGMHLIVQLTEYEDLRLSDADFECIVIDDVEVDVK